MKISELQDELRTLGLRTTGSKSVLESRLISAGQAGDGVVIHLEPAIPDIVKTQVATLLNDVDSFAPILNDSDLALAVELRFKRIKTALTLLDTAYGISGIQSTIDKEKANLKRAKIAMSKYATPLDAADAQLKQRMADYDTLVRFRQVEAREKFTQQLKDRTKESITAKATQLINAGDDDAGMELLSTLDNVDDRVELSLPSAIVESPQVDGVTFAQLKTCTVVDINQVRKKYLKPLELDKGAVRKVMNAMSAEDAEDEVRGIRVGVKASVRESNAH